LMCIASSSRRGIRFNAGNALKVSTLSTPQELRTGLKSPMTS
jgi:hypothetical protein